MRAAERSDRRVGSPADIGAGEGVPAGRAGSHPHAVVGVVDVSQDRNPIRFDCAGKPHRNTPPDDVVTSEIVVRPTASPFDGRAGAIIQLAISPS